VSVVCSDRYVETARDLVDERVGIVRMRADGSFATVRRARPNAGSVDPLAVHSILRQPEIHRIVRERFGPMPAMRPADREHYCRERFEKIAPRVAHRILRDALRDRFVSPDAGAHLKDIPRSVVHLYYKLKAAQRRVLCSPSILRRPIG